MSLKPIEENQIEKMKRDLRDNVRTNCLNSDEFKEQFMLVFKTMADLLTNTLGPYGSHTMIDYRTSYCMTKDGFHVLQNLRFASMEQERIRSTLFNISHQMVMQVGDGSTSAVLAAYEFLTAMEEEMMDEKSVFSQMRPKTINESIHRLVNELCDIINKNATPVNNDNYLNVVERIANIATNENTKYTKMLTDIYKKFGKDVNINLEVNPLQKDEVIARDDMYEATCKVLDSAFFNRDKFCDMDNPLILMFDHVMEAKHWDLVIAAFNYIAQPQQRQLLVIAPDYNDFYIDNVRSFIKRELDNAQMRKQTIVKFPIVHIRNYMTAFLEDREMYLDLAALVHADALTPKKADKAIEILTKYEQEVAVEYNKLKQDPTKIKEANEYYNSKKNNCTELKEILSKAIGTCGKVSAGVKFTYFSEFPKTYNALLETRKSNALLDLEEKKTKYSALTIPAVDLVRARTRYDRITCKFVTIKIGGSNEMEIALNNDSMDDAIKATKSAIQYGYNDGCNLAIIYAVYDYENNKSIEASDRAILTAIRNAFINVYKRVLRNYTMDEDKINEIVHDSIDNHRAYDLAKQCPDNEKNVINSAKTDTEILQSAIEMVSIILTCNQYVSQGIKV